MHVGYGCIAFLQRSNVTTDNCFPEKGRYSISDSAHLVHKESSLQLILWFEPYKFFYFGVFYHILIKYAKIEKSFHFIANLI